MLSWYVMHSSVAPYYSCVNGNLTNDNHYETGIPHHKYLNRCTLR